MKSQLLKSVEKIERFFSTKNWDFNALTEQNRSDLIVSFCIRTNQSMSEMTVNHGVVGSLPDCRQAGGEPYPRSPSTHPALLC